MAVKTADFLIPRCICEIGRLHYLLGTDLTPKVSYAIYQSGGRDDCMTMVSWVSGIIIGKRLTAEKKIHHKPVPQIENVWIGRHIKTAYFLKLCLFKIWRFSFWLQTDLTFMVSYAVVHPFLCVVKLQRLCSDEQSCSCSLWTLPLHECNQPSQYVGSWWNMTFITSGQNIMAEIWCIYLYITVNHM